MALTLEEHGNRLLLNGKTGYEWECYYVCFDANGNDSDEDVEYYVKSATSKDHSGSLISSSKQTMICSEVTTRWGARKGCGRGAGGGLCGALPWLPGGAAGKIAPREGRCGVPR